MMDCDFLWRGHRVHVTETGSAGDPLLLMGGLGSNTDMWAPFMHEFPDRRIIAFDAPGTGRSSAPSYPIPIARLAEVAVSVLDNRGVPWADVVGFSYGGAVAQQLAYDYPDRVRRLVLAATTCGRGSVPCSISAMAALATPLRFYLPGYFDATCAALYGGATGRDASSRARAMQARHRNPASPYGYAMQLLGGAGWSSWPFLARIPHETLVINGDEDPLVPVANAKMLSQRIPRARLEIVQRAGHLFLWDDAENVGPRIRQFVNPAQSTHKLRRRRAARSASVAVASMSPSSFGTAASTSPPPV
jgi:pimeloyl-ACP methyl ester carboxylesterase